MILLRERVTTDIATKGGQYDVMTIGGCEAPIWGKVGWLAPLDDLGDDYDYNDLLAPVRSGLTVDGRLYAVPFYAESSFKLYRKDLFKKAGPTMPEQPTYDQIKEFAEKLTDKSKEQYGICLRGKPGCGENMALIGTLVNTFGGRWFDMELKPQLTSILRRQQCMDKSRRSAIPEPSPALFGMEIGPNLPFGLFGTLTRSRLSRRLISRVHASRLPEFL